LMILTPDGLIENQGLLFLPKCFHLPHLRKHSFRYQVSFGG
jgi:hypothetical protein